MAAPSAHEAFKVAVDFACAATGWPIGHVYIAPDQAARDLVSSGVWHMETPERFATFRHLTEVIRITRGAGLAGRALVTASPTWVADMAEHPNFARAGVAWETGIRGGAAFPGVVDGKVVAVLELFTQEVVQLDTETRNLGRAVASALALRLSLERAPSQPVVLADTPCALDRMRPP